MKKTICFFLGIAFCSLIRIAACAQSCPKWGPYAGAKQMEGAAELMMADVMVPANGMAPFTYSCTIQFKLGKSGGYCGIQDSDGSDSVRPFNNIFSIWDYPNKIQIVHTYKDPLTFVGGFGNEGTGLHSHCDFGWKPDQWYTNVIRCWSEGGDKTFVAYFIYDHTKKQWRHFVTFAVPEKDAQFTGGISSFLENFGDEQKNTRTTNYKSYWKLLSNGTWMKPQTIETNAGEGNWNSKAYGDDGVMLTSCGKEMINGEKQVFQVQSAALKPDVIMPAEIYDLGAYYSKMEKKVYIDWSLKTTCAPQLTYQIQLFDSNNKDAKALATVSGFGPEIREASLMTGQLSVEKKDYYIVLTIKDIFDQAALPKQFILADLKP